MATSENTQIKKLKATIVADKGLIKSLKQRIKDLEKEKEELTDRVDKLEEENGELSDRIYDLENDNDDLEGEKEILKETNEELEDQVNNQAAIVNDLRIIADSYTAEREERSRIGNTNSRTYWEGVFQK